MGAELDAVLARAFGVALQTPESLSPDAEPEDILRGVERLGSALADRRPFATPERPWTALPVRAESASPPPARRAAIERMLAWARAGGASWDGIAFDVDDAGNASVRASRPLSPGEPVLRMPRHLMVIDNELAGATGAPGVRDPRPRDALAAWLPLEASAPASRWRPYLDVLPRQLAALPMFRGPAELAALTGTVAHALATDEARDVHDTYGRLSSELRARLSLADFAWGCALVMSRGFHAPGTFEHRVAMVPLIDMCNHGHGDTSWSYDPREGFVVTTERALAAGDELHFPYGDRSNTQLVVHYGFALPDNPVNEAGLVFDRAADPANDVAAHLLWQLPLDAPFRVRVACVLDDRFLRALSIARLQASGSVDRARAAAIGLAPHGDMPWLGAAIEHVALDLLAAAARRGLAALDADLVRSADLAWNRTCALVRDAERTVLQQIIEATRIAREALHWQDPGQLHAAADAIADAPGARGLVRQYLLLLAEDRTP